MDSQSLLTYNGDEAIVIYQSEDNTLRLDVRMAQDTVWLSQQQMAELFNSTIPNISIHIRNIYKEGELDKEATVKYFLIVQNEGGRQVTRHVAYYNLDVIISVGYRVKSRRGVLFRQWATKVLLGTQVICVLKDGAATDRSAKELFSKSIIFLDNMGNFLTKKNK